MRIVHVFLWLYLNCCVAMLMKYITLHNNMTYPEHLIIDNTGIRNSDVITVETNKFV